MRHLSLGIGMLVATASVLLVIEADGSCGGSPTPHVYLMGGGVGVQASVDGDAGAIAVADTNVEDCDGDGLPGDYDGDLDLGIGGGAFGLGPFADICGHLPYGGTYTVTDLLSANIAFITGADDMSRTNGDEDDLLPGCLTDGIITPELDADDCLSTVFVNTGTACGAGGDGLSWVFLLHAAYVGENSATVSGLPTSGFITATGGFSMTAAGDGGGSCEWWAWPLPPGAECGRNAGGGAG